MKGQIQIKNTLYCFSNRKKKIKSDVATAYSKGIIEKYFHSSYHEEQEVYCYQKKERKRKSETSCQGYIKQSTIQNIGSLLVSVI